MPLKGTESHIRIIKNAEFGRKNGRCKKAMFLKKK